jgi:hypothetical protein
LATVVVVGASCASPTSGRAQPAADPPPPTTSNTPRGDDNFGAPKVTTPLDTAKYQPNPCTTLTTAQQTALGITTPGTLAPGDEGAICSWSPKYDISYSFGFNLKFLPGEATGLANAYQTAGPGSMKRLPDVHGQPAATQPSQNTNGSCTIYLGATDVISYAAAVVIGTGEPHYADPCTIASALADATTATMKSGG